MTRMRAWVWAPLLLLLAGAPVRAAQYWELSPASDPRFALGTYTAVGGKTAPDGVNFTLKNNTLDNPVEVTVVSTTPNTTLHFSAFKDAAPFLDKDTDAGGVLVVRLRTGDDMHFKLAGPAGATYQMAVWRGPAIKMPPPDSIVAMDAAQAGAPRAAVASAAAGAPVAAAAAPAGGLSNAVIYILLGGIFVVLLAIAALIFRGQQMRGKP
jgi:hypothetical protein